MPKEKQPDERWYPGKPKGYLKVSPENLDHGPLWPFVKFVVEPSQHAPIDFGPSRSIEAEEETLP